MLGIIPEISPAVANCNLESLCIKSTLDQSPFNFLTLVPSRVKIKDRVDLSFYVNQAVVFQYRMKIEAPAGVPPSSLDKSLLAWSEWLNRDINEIVIPKLEKAGRYKLVIEYKTHKSKEIRTYEKPFEAYDENALKVNMATQSRPPSLENKDQVESEIIARKDPANESVTEKEILTDVSQITEKVSHEGNYQITEHKDTLQNQIAIPEETTNEGSINQTAARDYNNLLKNALEEKNLVLIMESLENGADLNLRGPNGGNIFHLLDETTFSDDLISVIKAKGFSIDEPDNEGNTPLHYAILSDNREYAKSLIGQGAKMDILNSSRLSPLHIAVFLNEPEMVETLVSNKAYINLKGNTGYTPLHVAAEMNHIDIASFLLSNGSKAKIKTDQKLNALTISKIQKNQEISRLISTNKHKFSNLSSNAEPRTLIEKTTPYYERIDFTLPYNSQLIKKRQLASLIQKVSAPVFVIGAAGAAYFKIEADKYYKQHRNAENQNDADYYYDKTKEYDIYTYSAGGISLASLYGFVHSTIWKKNTTTRMRKQF